MFLTHHPHLDAARLAERVRHSVQHQYHAQSLVTSAVLPAEPLVAEPLVAEPLVAEPPEVKVPGWRQQLKAVPGLGRSGVWLASRWRRWRNPNASRSERWRAVPLLGDAFAWGLALITLLQWRHQLRQQQVQLLAELNELRRSHAELQGELVQVRQQLRDALRRLQAGPPRHS